MLKAFFSPAISLMNQLRFNLKFSLIALLFLIPQAIIGYYYFHNANNLSQHTIDEIEGLGYLQKVDDAQQELVKFLVSNMSWRSGLNPPADEKDRVNETVQVLEAFVSSASWSAEQKAKVRQSIDKTTKSLKENSLNLGQPRWTAKDHFALLEGTLNQFNGLYQVISNLQGLTNDPQVNTVVLARLISEKRLLVLNLITRSYAVAAYGLGENQVSSRTFDSLGEVSDHLISEQLVLNNLYNISEGVEENLAQKIQADKQVQIESLNSILKFLEEEFLLADQVSLNRSQLDAFFNDRIKHYYQGNDQLRGLLKQALDQRLYANNASLLKVSIVAIVALLIVIYLFIGMTLSIGMTTNSLTRVASELAEGDTRVSANVRTKDELSSAITAFNLMANKVQLLVKSVQQASVGVAEQSKSVAQIAAQTGEAVNTQLQDTHTITLAIAELLEAVGSVSENTAQVVAALDQANQQTAAGRATLHGAKQATNELGEEIKQSVEVINQLSTQSESINQVLDVIKSIAEQTNLLALNAAIEAARAGDQGRGFAVVADEVRSLAKRTHESTEEIQSTIISLQKGVGSAVDAMKKSDQKAHRSIEESAKLESALDEITQAVDDINQRNSATEEASHRQQSIASQIESSLNSISQISSVTENNVQDSIAASQQLSQHVEKLETLIANFKT